MGSEQPEVIPNEKINGPDNTVREKAPSGKRKIFKRIWTYVLEKPGGTGTLLIGIAAVLTVIFKFVPPIIIQMEDTSISEEARKLAQIEKSTKSSEIEELIQKVAEDSKASIMNRVILDAYKLQLKEKSEEAVEKWKSIANVFAGIDNDLAAGAWYSVGYLRVQQAEYKKAISDFSKSLELKPDYVEAYYGRGDAWIKIGKLKEAIDDFGKVLEIDPDYVKAYYSRGFANLSLSKYKEANIDFKKALELKRNYIEAQKGLEETEVYLESIKPLNPNTANAEEYYSRGNARLKTGKFKEAIGDFDKALKLNSDYVEVYYSRAAAQFNIGQYQFAVADYNKFIRLNLGPPSAYANRGEAKIKLKQYKSAITDCNKAIQLNPNFAYAYYIRADAKFHVGDIEGEESDLKTALKIAEEVGDEKLKDQIELRFLTNSLSENQEKRDEIFLKNKN